MIILILLILIGFTILIKGADFLVEGAISLARRFRVSDFIIGLTLVAFGTSGPELFVNLVASLEKTSGIVIGNILGSNIANVFLVLGVSSIVFPLLASRDTVFRRLPLALLTMAILAILINDHFFLPVSRFSIGRIDGLILLIFFLWFLYHSLRISKIKYEIEAKPIKGKYNLLNSVLFVLIGTLGLIIGARLVVENALKLGRIFDLSDSYMGLTVVAFGTSLPELATSAVAAYKRNSDIAIGNVIGSNIFNVCLILGVSALINPLVFGLGDGIDFLVATIAMLLFLLAMALGKRLTLSRWEGAIFFSLYIAYLVLRFQIDKLWR